MALEIGLRRWTALDQGVGVDEGQVLALFVGEARLWEGDRHSRQFPIGCPSVPEEALLNVRYVVELSESERAELKSLIAGGKAAVRRVKRAQILLAADAEQNDESIATSVGVGTSTVYRKSSLHPGVSGPCEKTMALAGPRRGERDLGRPSARPRRLVRFDAQA